MKKTYYYVVHDEAKVHFDSGERLLQFLKDNTSYDEPVEIGVNENMTEEEFAKLTDDCETPGTAA